MSKVKLPVLTGNTIIIVGGYGSGKSEVSVNLARHLVQSQTDPVAIADLDIINPYFRSREAIETLTKLGIKSLVPEGGQFYADLPIVLPEIKGAIERNEGKLILDVGGDDAGARVLSSLQDAFITIDYDMYLVLNANRPFTSDVIGSIKMIEDIESSSRLKFTGLISNTHLMENTDEKTIIDGYKLAIETCDKTKLPLIFTSGLREIIEQIDLDSPILPLDRLLLKPWETKKPE